jgi:hypothetical protein
MSQGALGSQLFLPLPMFFDTIRPNSNALRTVPYATEFDLVAWVVTFFKVGVIVKHFTQDVVPDLDKKPRGGLNMAFYPILDEFVYVKVCLTPYWNKAESRLSSMNFTSIRVIFFPGNIFSPKTLAQKASLMNCNRCGGLMTYERFYGPQEHFLGGGAFIVGRFLTK